MALWSLVEQGTLRLLRGGYIVRRGRSVYALAAFPDAGPRSVSLSPSVHQSRSPQVVWFCSALWSGFSPPLTP